jgi:Tol biopolymer transport system component
VTLDARARRAARDFRDAVEGMDRSAPKPSAERFDRYRRQRERNSRFSAAALAIVVSVAAAILVVGALGSPRREVPANPPAPSGMIVFNDMIPQQDGSDFVVSYTVNPDGSDRTTVGPPGTTACGDNDNPVSPDGSKILCMVFRPDLTVGTVGTATVDADGSDYTVLSDPKLPKSFGCGAWSPDGTRLLCPWTSDGVYTVKPNGTGLLQLTSTPAGDGPSGYANDASHAYFTVKSPSEFRTLYSVNTDGTGGLTALSPLSVSVHDNGYFDGVSADSSPDGSNVVFAADVTNTKRALYVVNVDGSGLRQIGPPAGLNPTSAQWSPDGDWIAFSAPPTSNYAEVYLIHPNGTGLREVTSPDDACSSFAPIWSPDGTKLLFETQCYSGSQVTSTRLETANLDGMGMSKVADLNGLTSYGWGRLAASELE